MLRKRSLRLPLGLGIAGVLALASGAVIALTGGPLVVEVDMKYSRFEPETLRFEAGQEVTFVLRNRDPIDHEFILGDQEVQDGHELGTEPYHDQIPTEVTVPAGQTVETTVRMPGPGELIIGCHLPGHYAYGMKAFVVVE